MSHKARERIWIQRLLNKLLSKQVIRKMEILDDNKTTLTLTKDPKSQNYIKYIDVIHHYVQKLVENRKLGMEWISNSLILADGLMKVLPSGLFKRHRDKYGLVK